MQDNQRKNKPGRPNGGMQFWWVMSFILGILLITYLSQGPATVEVTYSKFEQMLREGDLVEVVVISNEKVVEATLSKEAIESGKYAKLLKQRSALSYGGPHIRLRVASIDNFLERYEQLQNELPPDKRIDYRVEERSDWVSTLLNWLFLFLMIFGFWFLMRRMSGGVGGGGQIFNIGRSRAALFDADNRVNVTFDDVAGLDEAKEEVKEIVEFLKNPAKFTRLGGKIPKGALLVGPPGTGKTLLAKAVAGEAGVPFFSLSGSDFVEMFVGVGAARVRDLFKQAKEKAPCIIFIDEIDAIGRSRSRTSMPGANDERENTLNSLLVEMDGFTTNSGVIILAATNRPDILDPALLRPGRFDRQIAIDKPDIVGREAIFKVHLRPLRLAEDVDPKKLAAQTPGFAGAEIANVCNEAALIAARKNKDRIDMQDFQDAIDRVIGGLEKKNKIISPEEKQIVAYHEAGHAIAGWFLEHADPLVKVSIVPRGVAALGYAQYLPKEQYLYQTDQLLDEMCMALGGRAAEEIVFGKISTGALSDLERVTKMAYGMVTIYGMNPILGHISYYDSKPSEIMATKPYSEATAQLIDQEVQKIVREAYERVKNLLQERRKELETVAKELLKREILFQTDLEELIGKRPFNKPTTYQSYLEQGKEKEESATPEAQQDALNGNQKEDIATTEHSSSSIDKKDESSS
ncbi:MAG: ATP-dependent zinc metalloprotease FtsH [Thermonema sp.]|uniref:ATP-dependent zinc metalloprotease FtsH n=1 Tax=Thermonema sp. TaxID=2231181 RepID=UPI0021DD1DB4|nr:ATP-dependent zinc metalloprotease FtsH [Thermonema sp.]GIV38613.1 MAG: ATP-dependent zinc metalloprotease FtsH [Thermonema sp.]